LKLRVKDKTNEIERTVETSNIFQNSSDRVGAPLIDIVLCVKLENLIEVYALSWSPIVV